MRAIRNCDYCRFYIHIFFYTHVFSELKNCYMCLEVCCLVAMLNYGLWDMYILAGHLYFAELVSKTILSYLATSFWQLMWICARLYWRDYSKLPSASLLCCSLLQTGYNPAKKDSSDAEKEQLGCEICDDRASGLHYGIISCEGWVILKYLHWVMIIKETWIACCCDTLERPTVDR